MLEHTDTITDKDEYIIVDDQVIGEIKQIKQSLKRKLSNDDDDDNDDENIQHLDDYQNEINIIKKTKRLSTVHDEHNNGPIHTSFVILVDDQIPAHTNGHHQETDDNDLRINTKKYKQNLDGKYLN